MYYEITSQMFITRDRRLVKPQVIRKIQYPNLIKQMIPRHEESFKSFFTVITNPDCWNPLQVLASLKNQIEQLAATRKDLPDLITSAQHWLLAREASFRTPGDPAHTHPKDMSKCLYTHWQSLLDAPSHYPVHVNESLPHSYTQWVTQPWFTIYSKASGIMSVLDWI